MTHPASSPAFENLRDKIERAIVIGDDDEKARLLGFAETIIGVHLRKLLNHYVREKMDRRLFITMRREVYAFLDDVLPARIKRHVFIGGDPFDVAMGSPTVMVAVPRFRHDCDECTFLGHVVIDHVDGCDLYTCEKSGIRRFIARRGNDLHDYTAGTGIASWGERPPPEMIEAMRRWEAE